MVASLGGGRWDRALPPEPCHPRLHRASAPLLVSESRHRVFKSLSLHFGTQATRFYTSTG